MGVKERELPQLYYRSKSSGALLLVFDLVSVQGF